MWPMEFKCWATGNPGIYIVANASQVFAKATPERSMALYLCVRNDLVSSMASGALTPLDPVSVEESSAECTSIFHRLISRLYFAFVDPLIKCGSPKEDFIWVLKEWYVRTSGTLSLVVIYSVQMNVDHQDVL